MPEEPNKGKCHHFRYKMLTKGKMLLQEPTLTYFFQISILKCPGEIEEEGQEGVPSKANIHEQDGNPIIDDWN